MDLRRDVFQAIADPNRRAIIDMVSQEQLTMNRIADNFEISRPAISKHIKILTECGLIVITKKGRERICEPNLQKLGEVSVWVNQYKEFWNKKLDALEKFLAQDSITKKNGGDKKRKNLKS